MGKLKQIIKAGKVLKRKGQEYVAKKKAGKGSFVYGDSAYPKGTTFLGTSKIGGKMYPGASSNPGVPLEKMNYGKLLKQLNSTDNMKTTGAIDNAIRGKK